jgi:hypothetical protein
MIRPILSLSSNHRNRILHSSVSKKRSFFASSTDHTSLLKNATIHRINSTNDPNGDPYGKRQYILIPNGTDLNLALKVDKLHLARISADRNFIYGAKVVQRTLGPTSIVCNRLVEAALEDIKSEGNDPIALASLGGLSRWVVKGIEGKETIQAFTSMDERTFLAVKAIATQIPREGHSVVGQGTYRDGEVGWSALAQEYINLGLSDEAKLYLNQGFHLSGIDTMVDTSREGILDAGGALARLTLNI